MGQFLTFFGPYLGPPCGLKSSKGPNMDLDPQVYYLRGTLGKKRSLSINCFQFLYFCLPLKYLFCLVFAVSGPPPVAQSPQRSPCGLKPLVLCSDWGISQKMDLICEFHSFFKNFSCERFFGLIFGHFWAVFGPPLQPKVFQRSPYGLGPPGILFERSIGQKKELVCNLFSSYGFLFASKIHFMPHFCSFWALLWPKVLQRSP